MFKEQKNLSHINSVTDFQYTDYRNSKPNRIQNNFGFIALLLLFV